MENRELLQEYKEAFLEESLGIKEFVADVWENMNDNIKKEYIERVISFIKSERNRDASFTVSELLEDGVEPMYSELLEKEFKEESDINLYTCSDDYNDERNIDLIALKMEQLRDFDCGIDYLSEKDFESWDKLGSIIFDF